MVDTIQNGRLKQVDKEGIYQDRNDAPERHAERCLGGQLQGAFRSLHQIRLGALSRNASSHANNQEIGIESSHPNTA